MAILCLAGWVTNGVMGAHGRLMLWCERRKPFQDSMLTSKTAIFKLRKELRSAIKTLTVAEEALVEVDSVVAGYVSERSLLRVYARPPSKPPPPTHCTPRHLDKQMVSYRMIGFGILCAPFRVRGESPRVGLVW